MKQNTVTVRLHMSNRKRKIITEKRDELTSTISALEGRRPVTYLNENVLNDSGYDPIYPRAGVFNSSVGGR